MKHSNRFRKALTFGLSAFVGLIILAGCAMGPKASATFTSTAGLTIPATGDQGVADPYPSSLAVSGMLSSATDVNVRIEGLTSDYPADLWFLVISPSGDSALLMAEAGDNVDIADVDLEFSAQAAVVVPNTGPLTSGTYQPADYSAGESMPAPAPAAPYNTDLTVFDGTNPNGTWELYAWDDAGSDVHSAAAWSLVISAQ